VSGRKHGGRRRPPPRTPALTPVGARGGAVAVGPVAAHHRRGPGWLVLPLLVLVVAAVVVSVLVRAGSGNGATSAVPGAPARAVPTAPATVRGAAPARTAAPTAHAVTPPPARQPNRNTTVTAATAALVGGGGMALRPAAGSAAAPAGAVGVTMFGLDSAIVDPVGRGVLARAAALIRSSKPAVVTVTGYASRVGEPTDNLALSRRRAVAVAAVLRSELGGAGPRIEVDGRGEAGQLSAGTSPSAELLDRRVVVATRAAR